MLSSRQLYSLSYLSLLQRKGIAHLDLSRWRTNKSALLLSYRCAYVPTGDRTQVSWIYIPSAVPLSYRNSTGEVGLEPHVLLA